MHERARARGGGGGGKILQHFALYVAAAGRRRGKKRKRNRGPSPRARRSEGGVGWQSGGQHWGYLSTRGPLRRPRSYSIPSCQVSLWMYTIRREARPPPCRALAFTGKEWQMGVEKGCFSFLFIAFLSFPTVKAYRRLFHSFFALSL